VGIERADNNLHMSGRNQTEPVYSPNNVIVAYLASLKSCVDGLGTQMVKAYKWKRQLFIFHGQLNSKGAVQNIEKMINKEKSNNMDYL